MRRPRRETRRRPTGHAECRRPADGCGLGALVVQACADARGRTRSTADRTGRREERRRQRSCSTAAAATVRRLPACRRRDTRKVVPPSGGQACGQPAGPATKCLIRRWAAGGASFGGTPRRAPARGRGRPHRPIARQYDPPRAPLGGMAPPTPRPHSAPHPRTCHPTMDKKHLAPVPALPLTLAGAATALALPDAATQARPGTAPLVP